MSRQGRDRPAYPGVVAAPARLAPMKAVSGQVPRTPGWTAEVKWDGMRALVHLAGGRVGVRNARGADVSAAWPDLDGLSAAAGGLDAVLDGEVVALDGSGRPSFERLQQRMHARSPGEVERRAARVPAHFMAFDLLHLDGRDLVDLGLEQRRSLLVDLLPGGPRWAVPPTYDDPSALLEAVRAQGLEGIVAKRSGSPYRPGRRSPDWRKTKLRPRQELVVGGVTPAAGARSGAPGALLVGYHERAGGPLRYAGASGRAWPGAWLRR